ncbi:MAG: imidazole glycerol phosphate synthase subunit HisH [Rubricoccaceae bacterium]|nr:imidazole glycerol phosphate synthase subunit HisH [Rubricoccaceae bacterium]
MSTDIAIVDYDMGNVGSVENMLKKAGRVRVSVTRDAKVIEGADKVVLPGVGTFDVGAGNLERLGLREVLDRCVLEDRKPFLGICLGMQLLLDSSDEGKRQGLGYISGRCVRFKFDQVGRRQQLKVPHMGWNELEVVRPMPLLEDLPESSRFYFVHAFYGECANAADVFATCRYGLEFPAVIARENVMGTQFHPEKSHRFGLTLMRNFLRI